jgi:ATP-dependent DNA helicase RecG
MHRSYRVQGAIQIIRYANRLEIHNPGHSLVAEDRLGEPGSETRNPIIAAILHDTNLAETKGSGIRVMRQLMNEVGLTPPTFESDRERNQFVVTLLFHHFLSPEDWTWLRQFHDVELSDEEARALIFVRELGAITNAGYRTINHVDVLAASQHLRRLRNNGLLQQKGKGAETYYVSTRKLLIPWQSRNIDAAVSQDRVGVPQPPQVYPGLSPDSGNLTVQSGNLDLQSGNLPPQSANLVDRLAAFPGLPDDLARAVLSLKKRASQQVIEELAWRLCNWHPMSTENLSILLDRNRKYVFDRLVRPMLRARRLEMTIPGQPNHPEQQYRATLPPENRG